MKTKYEWSKLNLNITHYGYEQSSFRRASVCITVDGYQLFKLYKGCEFNPEPIWFDSIEKAKEAGVAWVDFGK